MSILLAEGEQVIRKYRCAVVDYRSSDKSLDAIGLMKKKPDTDGLVVVTNRRVLYYAEGRSPAKGATEAPLHMQEAFIDRISSTEFVQADAKKNVTLPLALLIIGLLLTIYGITDGMELMYMIPGIIVLAFGAILLVLAMRGIEQLMVLRINTLASETGIRVSGMSQRDEKAMTFYMVPTSDFKVMASELGAIILDVQAAGDDCIAKWTSE